MKQFMDNLELERISRQRKSLHPKSVENRFYSKYKGNDDQFIYQSLHAANRRVYFEIFRNYWIGYCRNSVRFVGFLLYSLGGFP